MKCVYNQFYGRFRRFFTLVEKAILEKALCSVTSSYSLTMGYHANRIPEIPNIEIYKDFLNWLILHTNSIRKSKTIYAIPWAF